MARETVGQISIFDFIKPSEPDIILHPGEHVYKVIKGDIIEYEVEDWTYTCGEHDRGYGLVYIDPENPNSEFHTYSRAWNSSFEGENQYIFRDRKEAEQKAKENLKRYEHILAEDIKPNKVVAYEFTYYGGKRIYFYAELSDGSVYRDSDGCFAHIGKAETEIATFNRGMKAKEEQLGITRLIDYKPKFKNMYECEDRNWKYAESGYGKWGI